MCELFELAVARKHETPSGQGHHASYEVPDFRCGAVTPGRLPGNGSAHENLASVGLDRVSHRFKGLTRRHRVGTKQGYRHCAENGQIERPGCDGGSGYWIPTSDWSVCRAAENAASNPAGGTSRHMPVSP